MSSSPAESLSVTFLGDFSKKLTRNTFFNLLGRSWSFLVTLILTPYILKRLDVGEFAIWVLLGIFSNSLNLLDFGLGSSFVKYISAYYTHKDYDRINEVIFSGLAYYGLFGLALTTVGLLLERPLFSWFHISGASDVYVLVLIACSVQNIAVMFLSVFKGIQRMDKSNSIEIKMSIVNLAGTVLFLEFGLGMLGLAANILFCAVIATAATWWAVRRMIPEIHIGWHFNAGLLREMFGYGAKIQVSRLGERICLAVDKLIISRLFGIAAVSFYEVSSRLASFMRAVPLVMMLSALIPATSELDARKDREKILRTYYLASKYVSILTVALAAFMIIEAGSLVNLWIGSGFEQSVILIQILAIGYGVNALGGAASQTGAGVGRPEFDMRSMALLAFLNPILSVLLARRFGTPGAAAGTSLALVCAAVYLLTLFHRDYVGDSVWKVLQNVHLWPVIAGAFASFGVAGFHHLVPELLTLDRIRYFIPLKMAADLAIFAPVYVVLLIALRQVNAIDWNNFLGLVYFGYEFLRHPFRERVKI
jgi:O-antigen/teichoic acid export membrane protein